MRYSGAPEAAASASYDAAYAIIASEGSGSAPMMMPASRSEAQPTRAACLSRAMPAVCRRHAARILYASEDFLTVRVATTPQSVSAAFLR